MEAWFSWGEFVFLIWVHDAIAVMMAMMMIPTHLTLVSVSRLLLWLSKRMFGASYYKSAYGKLFKVILIIIGNRNCLLAWNFAFEIVTVLKNEESY